MVKKRKMRYLPVGIADKTKIDTGDGIVSITNYHLGQEVYEVRVTNEFGDVIGTSGEITRGNAWHYYLEICEKYRERGNNDLEEILDFEEGLPDNLVNSFNY